MSLKMCFTNCTSQLLEKKILTRCILRMYTRWDPKVFTVTGNTNVNIGLRMTKSSQNM